MIKSFVEFIIFRVVYLDILKSKCYSTIPLSLSLYIIEKKISFLVDEILLKLEEKISERKFPQGLMIL